MPDEIDDIEWGPIVEKGLEAAAVAFGSALGGEIGAALGKMIASSLFESGGQDKFANAIQDLKESIHQMIDQAFLNKEIADLVGIGMNLKSYLNSFPKDEALLTEIHGQIPLVLSNLATKDSFEAFTAFVYAVNVYILILRAKAVKIPTYYQEVKNNLNVYAKNIEDKANQFRLTMNDSLTPPLSDTEPHWSVSNLKPALVETKENGRTEHKPGFTYEVSCLFKDNTITDPSQASIAIYKEQRSQPYPFRGIDSEDDLFSGYLKFTYEDIKDSKALLDYVRDRQSLINQRTNSLNKILNPAETAIIKWRAVANVIPEATPSS
ncbi:hypothetical protein ASG89_25280 [Paenibacillus sp. Soil766]|nr:hypothetical protein ASG89_25280 [Paenibacillus sp. Soil766]